MWSRSGDELFFRRDNAIFAVNVERSEPVIFGQPERLFEISMPTPLGGRQSYDVSAVGRFLTTQIGKSYTNVGEFRVVTNWFEVLEAQSYSAAR